MIDMRSPDPDKPALGPALCSLLRFERWVFLFQKRKMKIVPVVCEKNKTNHISFYYKNCDRNDSKLKSFLEFIVFKNLIFILFIR